MRKLLLLCFAPLLIGGQAAPLMLEGETPIASNGDFNVAMRPSWGSGAIPGSAAPDVVGAFRFICTAGQVLPDDPIVFPGQPGKSHLHQFYGNEAANAFSTYASLRAGGQSTCNRGPFAANRSAYWMPAMLDGAGNVVKPGFVSIYYKRRPAADPKCSLVERQSPGRRRLPADPERPQVHLRLRPVDPQVADWFAVVQLPGAGRSSRPLPEPRRGPRELPGEAAHAQSARSSRRRVAGTARTSTAPTIAITSVIPVTGLGLSEVRLRRIRYVIPTFTLGAWYPVASGMHFSSDAMVPNAVPGHHLPRRLFRGLGPDRQSDVDRQLHQQDAAIARAGDLGNGRAAQGRGDLKLTARGG